MGPKRKTPAQAKYPAKKQQTAAAQQPPAGEQSMTANQLTNVDQHMGEADQPAAREQVTELEATAEPTQRAKGKQPAGKLPPWMTKPPSKLNVGEKKLKAEVQAWHMVKHMVHSLEVLLSCLSGFGAAVKLSRNMRTVKEEKLGLNVDGEIQYLNKQLKWWSQLFLGTYRMVSVNRLALEKSPVHDIISEDVDIVEGHSEYYRLYHEAINFGEGPIWQVMQHIYGREDGIIPDEHDMAIFNREVRYRQSAHYDIQALGIAGWHNVLNEFSWLLGEPKPALPPILRLAQPASYTPLLLPPSRGSKAPTAKNKPSATAGLTEVIIMADPCTEELPLDRRLGSERARTPPQYGAQKNPLVDADLELYELQLTTHMRTFKVTYQAIQRTTNAVMKLPVYMTLVTRRVKGFISLMDAATSEMGLIDRREPMSKFRQTPEFVATLCTRDAKLQLQKAVEKLDEMHKGNPAQGTGGSCNAVQELHEVKELLEPKTEPPSEADDDDDDDIEEDAEEDKEGREAEEDEDEMKLSQ
ncbi:uncharacterized protein LTR77_006067 [Saxophila tyrrhenica]|uniref:Uncharacterized protein n=1 Tax=Saxophila tyrrhenica TaxID=1690608 RepID=A0AAV9P6U5_9PEZI|nr:hypothetical protein LTR77_006067 [Saxophila tyrrhenica]